jgi:hypothetical protein
VLNISFQKDLAILEATSARMKLFEPEYVKADRGTSYEPHFSDR